MCLNLSIVCLSVSNIFTSNYVFRPQRMVFVDSLMRRSFASVYIKGQNTDLLVYRSKFDRFLAKVIWIEGIDGCGYSAVTNNVYSNVNADYALYCSAFDNQKIIFTGSSFFNITVSKAVISFIGTAGYNFTMNSCCLSGFQSESSAPVVEASQHEDFISKNSFVVNTTSFRNNNRNKMGSILQVFKYGNFSSTQINVSSIECTNNPPFYLSIWSTSTLSYIIFEEVDALNSVISNYLFKTDVSTISLSYVTFRSISAIQYLSSTHINCYLDYIQVYDLRSTARFYVSTSAFVRARNCLYNNNNYTLNLSVSNPTEWYWSESLITNEPRFTFPQTGAFLLCNIYYSPAPTIGPTPDVSPISTPERTLEPSPLETPIETIADTFAPTLIETPMFTPEITFEPTHEPTHEPTLEPTPMFTPIETPFITPEITPNPTFDPTPINTLVHTPPMSPPITPLYTLFPTITETLMPTVRSTPNLSPYQTPEYTLFPTLPETPIPTIRPTPNASPYQTPLETPIATFSATYLPTPIASPYPSPSLPATIPHTPIDTPLNTPEPTPIITPEYTPIITPLDTLEYTPIMTLVYTLHPTVSNSPSVNVVYSVGVSVSFSFGAFAIGFIGWLALRPFCFKDSADYFQMEF